MAIRLVQTCRFAPEQYDAINEEGTQVGYLRLRGGYFTVEVPEADGVLVYEAETQGQICFTDEERPHHLALALQAIESFLH